MLAGAKQTIQKHRPILFIENKSSENPNQLIEMVLGQKYRCWWQFSGYLNREDLEGKPFKPGEGFYPDINMLCLPEEWKSTVNGFLPVLGGDDSGEKALARLAAGALTES